MGFLDTVKGFVFGTDDGSNEKVPKTKKKVAREVVRGGSTSLSSDVSPTDFIPTAGSEDKMQIPDHYRNGQVKSRQEQVGDELVTVNYWDPVPHKISMRWDASPVLASIRLVKPGKKELSQPGSEKNSQLIPEYTKMFLESVQESHKEKFQIVQTFYDWYAFFYGENPPIYRFQGHLLNTTTYNWMNEFMYYYENFWRGTKAVEAGAKIYLTYNNQQIQGYILDINTSLDALTDKAAPFSFSALVTKRLIFKGSEDDDVLSDSLLPKADDTGLINTKADPDAKQQVIDYMNGQRAAAHIDEALSTNKDRGKRIINDGSKSTPAQNFPLPIPGGFDGVSKAVAQADKLKSGLNLGGLFG